MSTSEAPTDPRRKPPPALYEHACTIWHAMEASAETTTEGLVYEGMLTKLFAETGVNLPYYTQVMRLLEAMDCAIQLRRGGGGSPSRWLLLQVPTVELFDGVDNKLEKVHGKDRSHKSQIMEQQNRDLNVRVSQLETRLEALEELILPLKLEGMVSRD